MKWLWTWGGECFGYLDGDDLWTYDGKHVGRRHGNEIYAPDGRYLGEIMNADRLITNRAKRGCRGPPLGTSGRRSGYARYANYAGHAMYAGYEDFPSLDEFGATQQSLAGDTGKRALLKRSVRHKEQRHNAHKPRATDSRVDGKG